jgi:hypothetical protein
MGDAGDLQRQVSTTIEILYTRMNTEFLKLLKLP